MYKVQELGASRGRDADSSGQFQFPRGKPVTILFLKDGFSPQIRMISGSEDLNSLSVVLEPESKTALKLRSCRRERWLLPELDPAKVRGLQFRRHPNIEYASYSATYKYGGSVAYLSSMTGIHVGGLTPTPEWVAGLSAFTVRSLMCGGTQWFDLRGATDTALQSRWVGTAGSHVECSKVPAPVAQVLDKAIDNGCCR